MIALDTNILIRFLMNDDKKQTKKVYDFFKKAEDDKEELFISLLVTIEMIWVLGFSYNISRESILDSLSDLLSLSILKFEHQQTIYQFIHSAKKNSYDLSDLLIAHSANNQGCKTSLTFDKKASKYNLFELLK